METLKKKKNIYSITILLALVKKKYDEIIKEKYSIDFFLIDSNCYTAFNEIY